MCIVMVLLEVTKTKTLGHKSLKQILFHSTFDLNSCNVENASLDLDIAEGLDYIFMWN